MATELLGAGGEQGCSLGASSKKPLQGMALLFEDPITLELMENATIAKCGHTFSSSTIRPYVDTHGKCPICSHTLTPSDLATDYKLNEAIHQYNLFLKQEGTGSTPTLIEEEITSLTIPLAVNTEELNRQINPNYKSPLDDFKLIIDILRAKDIANQQRRGISSPYCTIEFGGRKRRTSVVKSNLNPEWRECFIFDVKDDKTSDDDDIRLVKYEEHPDLIVDVWDSCKIGKDKFMGRAVASWDEISQHKNQIVKIKYPLRYHSFEKEKRKVVKQKETSEAQEEGNNKKKSKKTKNKGKSKKNKEPTITGEVKLKICYANLRKLKATEGSTTSRAPRASFILKVEKENNNDSPALVPQSVESGEDGNDAPDPGAVVQRNSYDLDCPYENCGAIVAAYLFPSHVANHHADAANQRFGCPVCQFVMGSQFNYAVTNDTNLLQHLRQMHASDLNNN